MKRLTQGRMVWAVWILLLVVMPMVIQAQAEPALVITVGRPDPANDRRAGEPVAVPGQNIFTVEIALTGGECPTIVRTQPVDVVLVVDTSGSMSGEPIQALQNSLNQFVAASDFTFTNTPQSDQIAMVKFGDPDAAAVVTRTTTDSPYEVNTAFSRNIGDLQTSISTLSATGGSTHMSPALALARQILDGPQRNLEGNALPVLIILTDGGVNDNIETFTEIDTIRRQVNARIVVIGLGDSIERNFITRIADPGDAYFPTNPTELVEVYRQIAGRIQPSVAAENITLTYTVNDSLFILRPQSINPAPQAVNGSAITWSPLSRLDRSRIQNYTFEIEARGAGIFEIGSGIAEYIACQVSDTIQTTTFTGPIVTVLQPTATPTPTATFTPTVTPTPTVTSTATPPGFVTTPTNLPAEGSPVSGNLLCDSGVWSWLPWIAALVALALALWWLRRRWQKMNQKSSPSTRKVLCFLLTAAAVLFTVFLIWLFLQPVSGAFCDIPESVYFWRLSGSSSGVYITNDNMPAYQMPAPVPHLNSNGCVGCHTAGLQDGPLVSTGNTVPGSLFGVDLEGELLALPEIPGGAVYASVSPDGTRLVVSTGDARLYIIPLTGGGSPTLLRAASEDGYGALMPTWTADGQQIAYVRARNNQIDTYGLRVFYTSEIYVVAADGNSAPLPLLTAAQTNGQEGLNYYPSFSPDGRWMAFTRHTDSAGDTYASRAADIWLLNTQTLVAQPIASNAPEASDSWPTWNRTSTRLAFNTTRFDQSFDIVTVDIDTNGTTSNLRVMPGASQPGVFEHLPVWGPPPARVDLMTEWLNLLPWLIPWFILVGLAVLCAMLRGRNKRNTEPELPLPPYQKPPQTLGARELGSWAGIEALWEPQPTLIVGLGASGYYTLAQIKKTLAEASLGEPSPKVRMLCIITGEDEPLRDTTFSGLPLEEHELIHWRDSLHDMMEMSQNDPVLREWVNRRYFEQSTTAALDPKQGFLGQRTLGRMALINNMRGDHTLTEASLWERLQQEAAAVRDQMDARERDSLTAIIIADLSDDVGSGGVFDTAFLLRHLSKQNNMRIKTVRLIGHLYTHRATSGRGVDKFNDAINTAAALRELGRFQLAGGAPFVISYDTPDKPILKGELRNPLFDEVYLHDGQRTPAFSADPKLGVYPAVADSIALWMDVAAKKGNLAKTRADLVQITFDAQIKQRQLMVGAMGIYQFRLPFADLLEEITVRYAREVLQYLLMGNSSAIPRFDHSLVTETFASAGNDPAQLVADFLREKFGSPPQTLNESWRRLFRALLQQEPKALENAVQKLVIDDDNLKGWSAWLDQMVLLILNGASDKDENASDPREKRGAKIGLAYAFLSYLDKTMLPNFNGQLVNRVNPNPDVVTMLNNFANYTRALHKQIEEIGQALGINMRTTSLYASLSRRAENFKQREQNLYNLITRKYILRDADGYPFATKWYEQYVSKEVNPTLQQFVWEMKEGTLTLTLRIPDKTSDLGRSVPFDPTAPQRFEEELLKMGRYAAREIRSQESLSSILKNDLLSRDKFSDTVELLRKQSGVLLGINYNTDEVNRLQRGMVFSVSEQVEQAKEVSAKLINGEKRPDSVLMLATTDPFTFTVARTEDAIPLDAIASIKQDFKRYTDEVYTLEGLPVSIFAGETTAIEYEKRLGEIDELPRQFNPIVVTALSQRIQAEAYLLIVALSKKTGEWQTNKRIGVTFNSPETGLLELVSAQDLEQGSFCPLMLGMLAFGRLVSEQTARQIIERYITNDNLVSAMDTWQQKKGADWLDFFEGNCGKSITADLISITRLFISDLLNTLE